MKNMNLKEMKKKIMTEIKRPIPKERFMSDEYDVWIEKCYDEWNLRISLSYSICKDDICEDDINYNYNQNNESDNYGESEELGEWEVKTPLVA
ncbi:MAG: hypothetical protein ACLRRH_09850 [Clostridium sp.]